MQPTNKIILGTVQFGIPYGINNRQGMPAMQEVFDMLDFAGDNGVSMLDTAEAYGEAEAVIAAYHRQTGKRFSIISKFKGQAQIETYTRRKIELLGIDRLYSYMFHSFAEYAGYAALMNELKELKAKGLIEKIGISIYTNSELEAVTGDADIELVQLPFNLLDNHAQRGALLEKAKEAGKEIHVRSVFLQGLFFKDTSAFPAKLSPLAPHVGKLQQLALAHDVPLGQLALNYALAQPYVDKVLIGVDSIEQLRENLHAIWPATPAYRHLFEQVNGIAVEDAALLNPVNWK
ncbi:aldo/keto reductase [Chitinophaga sp. GCM10012297]|uniref:Aldo/keto reductase n=1 Tax=Chitinophaga chungangae TaxID=2821488 RepID=A0ABS3YF30_9BACT|nr:aldo/keto reductase [Chitinophaga chungangae]MBO9153287.1 aldo/keto reductase [Chitinophaga chungangae]